MKAIATANLHLWAKGVRHARTVAYRSPLSGGAEVAGRQLFKQLKKLLLERLGRNWLTSMWRAIKAYHDLPTRCGYSPHHTLFASDRIKPGLPWVTPA